MRRFAASPATSRSTARGPVVLPALEQVGGAIRCVALSGGGLELPQLTAVGTDLVVPSTFPMPVVPALATVGGVLELDARGADAPALTHLQSALALRITLDPIDRYELPALTTANNLNVEGPATFAAPSLTDVAQINVPPSLRRLEVPALVKVGLATLPGVDELAAPVLRDAAIGIRGDFTCRALGAPMNLARLTVVDGAMTTSCGWPDAPRLQTVRGSVSVTVPPSDRPLLPALRTVGGDLAVTSTSEMGPLVEMPQLSALQGGLVLTRAQFFRAPLLTRVAFLRSGPKTEASLNRLRGITLAGLTTIDGELFLASTIIQTLELPALRSVQSIVVVANRQLCNSIAEELVRRTGAPASLRDNRDLLAPRTVATTRIASSAARRSPSPPARG